jgi:endo-1,4-beta-xylanase
MKKHTISKLFITLIFFALLLAGCSGLFGEKDGGGQSPDNIMNLPPLKDQFTDYFMMGNIATGGDYSGGKITNQRLLRHYNVLTAENNMKPNALTSSRSGTTVTISNWSNADNFVNAAIASNFKVVGHTLLWHSQIPQWQTALGTDSTSAADVRIIMESWITQVVTRYKGKIYSWDVLNEVFNDSGSGWKTSMRNNNPWARKIGSDFVYYAFLAARNADPDAILYYNDYNLDMSAKANMVRDMVKEVNDKYKAETGSTRLLIEGIGMQSHHNTNVPAGSIKASLDKFKPLGVKISISELDVLSGGYSSNLAQANQPQHSSVTEANKTKAAGLYGEYFKVFLDYSDIIERVTFWGVYDEQSWRSSGVPLPFAGVNPTTAKPAYGKIIDALDAHQSK